MGQIADARVGSESPFPRHLAIETLTANNNPCRRLDVTTIGDVDSVLVIA